MRNQIGFPSKKLERLIEKWSLQRAQYRASGDHPQARQCQQAIDAAKEIIERRAGRQRAAG